MNLVVIRKEKGYTQKRLAKESNVNLKTIQSYENGFKNINKASGEILYKLAVTLRVPIEDLLEEKETII